MLRACQLACVGIVAAASIGPTSAADSWPQFRGPTGQGHTAERRLPIEWGGDEGKNVLWKAALVGQGHASPIVHGGRVIVCTAHWPENVKDRAKTMPEHHVACYAAADGSRLWDTLVPPGPWLRSDFRSGAGGGYAAPTPATDGKRIFVVFGSAVFAALDFEGRLLWRHELKPFTFDVTVGSSPILYGDTVLLLFGMANKADSKLVAYHAEDGSVKWTVPLPRTGLAHSTPLLIQTQGKPQLIVAAAGFGGESDEGVQSFDPADGRRLWWCRGPGEASSPAFGAGIVYCDSGRGGPGVAIDPTGGDNVTATHIRWRQSLPEAIGSPLITGDLVYRVQSPGVLRCWHAADGKQAYAVRLEGLTSTWASPIVEGNGRLFLATAGKSYVVQTGPEYKELAVNDLGDANHASPAIADGRMFLMGLKQLYCVGEK